MRLTLTKKERLSSRKEIEELLEKGKTTNYFPLRVIWMEKPAEEKVMAKIAVSVPKKRFKKAVDRNRIKRLIRESYRKNKALLQRYCEAQQKTLLILFVYNGNELPSYKDVEVKIILYLKRFEL